MMIEKLVLPKKMHFTLLNTSNAPPPNHHLKKKAESGQLRWESLTLQVMSVNLTSQTSVFSAINQDSTL